MPANYVPFLNIQIGQTKKAECLRSNPVAQSATTALNVLVCLTHVIRFNRSIDV